MWSKLFSGVWSTALRPVAHHLQMKWIISKVQESVMALNDNYLLHSKIYKKSGLNVQLLYNKYNYFLPIGGAVTKLTE